MIEWIDDLDLPKLRSIQLDESALNGDGRDDRKTIRDYPYNYKNTLTMKSNIDCDTEWIDLPSLTYFNGDGYNFRLIGSVALKSSDWSVEWRRYPSIIIQWNWFR